MIGGMSATTELENQWPLLLASLPDGLDLDATARQAGLFQRVRAIKNASDLLRLVFAYAVCGQSLKQTVFWAESQDIASISAVGLYKQFRQASIWMEHLLASVLAEETEAPSNVQAVRVVDGTHVNRRGTKKLDQRVHLALDLASLRINRVELTDYKQGESLRRFPVGFGEWVIGDAGYAKRPALWHVVEAEARFIVRHNWQSVPLLQPGGEPFDLFAALAAMPDNVSGEFAVGIGGHPTEPGRVFAARLVALRKSPEATETARKRLLSEATRKKRTIDPRSLVAAGYVLLLTTIDKAVLPADKVLTAYRFRWQVELAFKRLKSLVHLDDLPLQDQELARTVIYARLLVAVLMDRLMRRILPFFPSETDDLDPPNVAMARANAASADDPHRDRWTDRGTRLAGKAFSQQAATR